MPHSAIAVPVAVESAPSTGSSSVLLLSRRRQLRGKRPRRSNGAVGERSLGEDWNKGSGGSVVFTVFLVGLVFSLVDVVYMMSVVHRTDLDGKVADTTMKSSQTTGREEMYSGKKEIIDLLKRAHLDPEKMDEETISELPTWDEVVSLYGPKPVIYGLDRCTTFQDLTQRIGFVTTAGTFNSGTNLMAELLIANCHMQERMNKLGANNRGVRWQVPWGKHTPLGDEEFRKTHKTDHDADISSDQVLPAVTIRDPLTWLLSMCHLPYAAKWQHTDKHCPDFSGNNLTTNVKYAEFNRKHDSILGLWNDYYRDYLEAPWPRLIVRIEDLIFHPEETTKTVCECAGGSMRKDGQFGYIVDSAKKGEHAHGKVRTGMVEAIIKYGSTKKRYDRYVSPKDLEYIRDHVDPQLFQLAKYAPIDPSKVEI